MPCVFLVFPTNQDGFLCFDPKLNKMYLSHDVQFYKEDFSLNLQLREDYIAKSPVKSNYFFVPIDISLGGVDSDMNVSAQNDSMDPVVDVPAQETM